MQWFNISNRSAKAFFLVGRSIFIGLAGITGLVLGGPLLAVFCTVGSVFCVKLLMINLAAKNVF